MSRSSAPAARVARRQVTIAACNVCGRTILPEEGGVEVRGVSVKIADQARAGDLCVDHLGPITEAAEVLDPVVAKRARRTFADSIVASPDDIPSSAEGGS